MSEAKPHAVCIPYPAQGHITPMLTLAKILHSRYGFYITFVNTEHNHHRLLRSRGESSLNGLPSFRFEVIPDGLPPSDPNATQHIPSLSASVTKNCQKPFKELLKKLNEDEASPQVRLIVSDCSMSFSLDVSEEMSTPIVFFWTSSACSFLGYAHYSGLIDKGIVPLRDATCMRNGYLDQVIDGIPGMEGIHLKDLPSFVRTTNRNDTMLNLLMHRVEKVCNSSSPIIFHTFDALEHDVLKAIATISKSPVYSVGPLQLLEKQCNHGELSTIGSNLWQEDNECLRWLDSKDPNSVLYINFGSVAVVDQKNMFEMACGLQDSKQNFLWVIRPDLVVGESAVLLAEIMKNRNERGYIANWCDQKSVLSHPAVGGFLTHCGWNSILDSLCHGVPLICWPFFADQTTNSWFCCTKWGVGLELDSNVNRDQVKRLINEVIIGEKGKQMKKRAIEWKKLAEEATLQPNGFSIINLEQLFNKKVVTPTS